MKPINVNMARFIVNCVFPLTEQVELHEVESNKRFYYKCKYAKSFEDISKLNRGDLVRFNGFKLIVLRGAK